MDHPESARLAWERVGALEAEVRRLQGLAGRAVARLHACAETLRGSKARESLVLALRANGVDTYRAMEVLQPSLAGLAMALVETATHLSRELEA